MKPLSALLIFLIPASLATVLNRDTCNHDNCYRAVAGTSSGIKPSLSIRQADCSSFMQTTITPNAVTTTITTTASPTTAVLTPPPSKRSAITASPTSIPSYAASSCALSPSRYSSACSCFNIPATTHTAPTPTVTTTITATPTPPAQCSNPSTCDLGYSSCGNPGSSDCYCGIDASDNALCFQDESCAGALACSANTDCAGNGDKTFCLVNSCCGNGVCINNDTCLNPVNPQRMFKPRVRSANIGLKGGIKVELNEDGDEVEMELFMTGLKPISL